MEYPSAASSIREFFDSLQSLFTPYEWDTILNSLDTSDMEDDQCRRICKEDKEWHQLHLFHCHWALKESFTKAKGMGLGLDLQRIEFRLSSSDASGDGGISTKKKWFDGQILDRHMRIAPKPMVWFFFCCGNVHGRMTI